MLNCGLDMKLIVQGHIPLANLWFRSSFEVLHQVQVHLTNSLTYSYQMLFTTVTAEACTYVRVLLILTGT